MRDSIIIPIWEKSNLTLEEAAAYSNIGINKLREITNDHIEIENSGLDVVKYVYHIGAFLF